MESKLVYVGGEQELSRVLAGLRDLRGEDRLALIAVLVLLVLPGATVTLIVVPSRVRSDVQLIGSTAGSRQDGHFLTKVLNVTQSQKLTVTATGSRTVTTPAGTRIVTVVQPSD